MSNNEISKTLKELYELCAMRTELDDEITALEDRIKAEMTVRGVDELEGAGHTAKYAELLLSYRIVPGLSSGGTKKGAQGALMISGSPCGTV